MQPTRRKFIMSTFASVALLAVGGEAFAQTMKRAGVSPAGGKPVSKNTEWKTVKVDGSDMRVYVARPEGLKGKVPAVIVLQEIFGVNHYIRGVTERIAALGYVAVAPELFHRTRPGFEGDYANGAPGMEEMKKMTDAGLEADLKAVADMLGADAQVDGTRLGAVGYCMGGRAAFFANAVLPLKVAASYYGAGIAPDLLDRAKDQHGPILLNWGGKDTHIGRDKQNAVADALKKAGKPYTDVEYSEAEHGFFCDERASYNAAASRESWALFSAFFKEYLNS